MSSHKRFHAAIAGKFGSERHEPHFHIDAVAVELLDLLDFRRRLKDEIGGQAFAEYTGRIGGTGLAFFTFGLIVKLIAGERPTLEMAAAAMRRARCIEAVLGKIVVKLGRKRRRCVGVQIFLVVSLDIAFFAETLPAAARCSNFAGIEALLDIEPFLRTGCFLTLLAAEFAEDTAEAALGHLHITRTSHGSRLGDLLHISRIINIFDIHIVLGGILQKLIADRRGRSRRPHRRKRARKTDAAGKRWISRRCRPSQRRQRVEQRRFPRA